MARADSFLDGLWGFDSLDDLGALLGSFIQSPVAAALLALVIALLLGVGLLGRAAPQVAPGSAPAGLGARYVPALTGVSPQSYDGTVQRGSAKDGGQLAKQLRHRWQQPGSSFDSTSSSNVQLLAKVKLAQALDLRLFGARSNPSLERGPPGEDILNSIAGRKLSNRYPPIGTRKARLR
jgi:hypothetical protein